MAVKCSGRLAGNYSENLMFCLCDSIDAIEMLWSRRNCDSKHHVKDIWNAKPCSLPSPPPRLQLLPLLLSMSIFNHWSNQYCHIAFVFVSIFNFIHLQFSNRKLSLTIANEKHRKGERERKRLGLDLDSKWKSSYWRKTYAKCVSVNMWLALDLVAADDQHRKRDAMTAISKREWISFHLF